MKLKRRYKEDYIDRVLRSPAQQREEGVDCDEDLNGAKVDKDKRAIRQRLLDVPDCPERRKSNDEVNGSDED